MKPYTRNHYVPRWYQRRFIDTSQKDNELYYLDLHAQAVTDKNSYNKARKKVKKRGVSRCFVEDDLYTEKYGKDEFTNLEQLFFGPLDDSGARAVTYFNSFKEFNGKNEELENLLAYMCIQKLRTPKGLQWLREISNSTDHNAVLALIEQLQRLFFVIWSECIWLIADASHSQTKFIVSDHPVTIYNRECNPTSQWCSGAHDPDIRRHGSHTIFPLSSEKILVLTNASWIWNPFQSALEFRANPDFFRSTIFNWLQIQTQRYLTEIEVLEINLIIKSRAFQGIAAGKEEWLYPERHIKVSDWSNFGNGYLLMPDPREVEYTTGVIMGFSGGRTLQYDQFGRLLGDPEFGQTADSFASFQKFREQFEQLFGKDHRSVSFEMK